jgi:hypothetical protein
LKSEPNKKSERIGDLLIGYLLGLLFNAEDGVSMFLRYVG